MVQLDKSFCRRLYHNPIIKNPHNTGWSGVYLPGASLVFIITLYFIAYNASKKKSDSRFRLLPIYLKVLLFFIITSLFWLSVSCLEKYYNVPCFRGDSKHNGQILLSISCSLGVTTKRFYVLFVSLGKFFFF